MRAVNTNNTNPVLGWVQGHIYNTFTQETVTDALVTIGGSPVSTIDGYYLAVLPPGTHSAAVTAANYHQKNLSVVIFEGSLVTKDIGLDPLIAPYGDIDGDSDVDLVDATIAMKVLMGSDTSGLIRSDYATSGADVNGDGKIGMEEVIYIMQKIAGFR